MKRLLAFCFVVAACTATAATLNFSGTTVGDPTWNRPVANGNLPPNSLSGLGTAVPYDVFAFTVDTTGAYDFLSAGTNPTNWDNYGFLYHTSFNPVDQLTNVIIGSDDFPSIGLSGFDGVNLTAGTQYFFVTTGFENTDAGSFDNSISGQGNITASEIPEPSTWGLAGIGLAAIGLISRRRRS